MGLFKRQMQSTGLCRLENCNNSERSSRRFLKTNDAPYQTFGRRTLASTLGNKELLCGHFWLSVLSESLSCYLYVFIVCSTRISWTGSVVGHEPNLVAMALSSGIIMMLLMLIFRTVHVNPALTVAFLLTGRIPLIRAIVYVLVHCMSSVAAISLLYSISVSGHAGALGVDNPHPALESWQILVIEFVISFVVTMVSYTTCSYSSYTSARQHILEQMGQDCSNTLNTKSTECDNDNLTTINGMTNLQQNQGGLLISNLQRTHQCPATAAMTSNLTTAKKRPASSNFRVHPQAKGYLSDTYENSDFDYEYDNHRMYSSQQQSSPELSPASRVPPIEEMMHDECQLLAPNGFSLIMTPGQSFMIGLAYTLTSLTGIPASGASLNPARSFGPAFIMNRWDNHWVYWLGPILGAITAGFLYEFIFNPTRSSSACYLPKLFRLSAHDMAKVGSKSRTIGHNFSTAHHSPTSGHQISNNNLLNNQPLVNTSMRESKHHQQLIMPSTSLAHMHPYHIAANNLEQFNYIQQQQRRQHGNQIAIDTANFDHRSKSTAMINLIASKKQQSTINMPNRNNLHSNSSSNGSSSQDFGKFSTSGFRNLRDHSMQFNQDKPAFSEL